MAYINNFESQTQRRYRRRQKRFGGSSDNEGAYVIIIINLDLEPHIIYVVAWWWPRWLKSNTRPRIGGACVTYVVNSITHMGKYPSAQDDDDGIYISYQHRNSVVYRLFSKIDSSNPKFPPYA